MTRRHLTPLEAVSALRRGAAIGQFLGFERGPTFRYVEASAAETGCVVWACHKVDHGDGLFSDLGEFLEVERDEPDFDPDDPSTWEDPRRRAFSDVASAMDWCREALGADPDRWVNASMLGDEYLDARRALPPS